MPDAGESALRQICRRWHNILTPRLSARQKRHLNQFKNSGPALQAKAVRLLSRLLACGIAEGAIAGKPEKMFIGANSLAFAYAQASAFCLSGPANMRIAIDAVASSACNAQTLLYFFNKSGLVTKNLSQKQAIYMWLLFEAIIKMGVDPFLAARSVSMFHNIHAKIPQNGQLCCLNQNMTWRVFPAAGCYICVLTLKPLPLPIKISILHWRQAEKIALEKSSC